MYNKHKRSRQFYHRLPSQNRGSTLTGLFIGVLIGLATALTVALYVHFSQLPFLIQQPQIEKSVHTEAQSLVHGIFLMQTQPPPPAPVPKNTYHFYDMLAGVHSAPPVPATRTVPEKNYVIVGEYLNTDEANNVRARLALSGIEASIQTDHRNNHLVYRIRIGPFAEPKEAQATLHQLREMGVAAIARSETL